MTEAEIEEIVRKAAANLTGPWVPRLVAELTRAREKLRVFVEATGSYDDDTWIKNLRREARATLGEEPADGDTYA